jgi:hypothetical protein
MGFLRNITVLDDESISNLGSDIVIADIDGDAAHSDGLRQ